MAPDTRSPMDALGVCRMNEYQIEIVPCFEGTYVALGLLLVGLLGCLGALALDSLRDVVGGVRDGVDGLQITNVSGYR